MLGTAATLLALNRILDATFLARDDLPASGYRLGW